MSITKTQGGFFEWHDHVKEAPGLGVETRRIEECIAHYHDRGFRGLFGNPAFGFDQDNLDFLDRTRNLEWLWFWDISLNSIDAIYGLADLKRLGINPKRPGIDFSRLPSPRSVVNHWMKEDTGVTASAITEYDLWHFKPKAKSFAGLEIPRGVEELQLFWANPAALAGLPVMRKLKVLQIHRCRNLHDLSDLPRIAPNLRRLLTTTSSKVDTTAGVLDHPTLQEVLVDGKFVVGGDG